MNNNIINNSKVKYVNYEIIGSFLFLITIILSILLSYDEKLRLENKPRLFSNKVSQNLALFQTLLLLFITFLFLYTNYNEYLISKNNNESNQKYLKLQAESSVLSILSAVISLYIVIKNYNGNLTISETENR